MKRPDQLDVQIEMALRAIRRDFNRARERVRQWEPKR